jgi:hypothetical protein
MNETTHLKNTNVPRMLGSLIHKNELLKFFAVALLLMSIIIGTVLTQIVSKPPVVIPLTGSGDILGDGSMPKPESEIKRAINAYLELRYKWEPKTVDDKLKNAEKFIAPQSLKAYRTQIANVARFSKEKLVTQKIYPSDLSVDLDGHKVRVVGDRITSVQGLKASGDLILELEYQGGDRTKNNPWGVYITKEKEANQ